MATIPPKQKGQQPPTTMPPTPSVDGPPAPPLGSGGGDDGLRRWKSEAAYLRAIGLRYQRALKRIVGLDYRGNMPEEQAIAREALMVPEDWYPAHYHHPHRDVRGCCESCLEPWPCAFAVERSW